MTYKQIAMPIWRVFERQVVLLATFLALAKAGINSATKTAIIAMTTSNSIKVKPMLLLQCDRIVRFFE